MILLLFTSIHSIPLIYTPLPNTQTGSYTFTSSSIVPIIFDNPFTTPPIFFTTIISIHSDYGAYILLVLKVDHTVSNTECSMDINMVSVQESSFTIMYLATDQHFISVQTFSLNSLVLTNGNLYRSEFSLHSFPYMAIFSSIQAYIQTQTLFIIVITPQLNLLISGQNLGFLQDVEITTVFVNITQSRFANSQLVSFMLSSNDSIRNGKLFNTNSSEVLVFGLKGLAIQFYNFEFYLQKLGFDIRVFKYNCQIFFESILMNQVCPTAFLYNSSLSTCEPCLPNCLNCSYSIQQCLQCEPGLLLIICTTCVPIHYCISCSADQNRHINPQTTMCECLPRHLQIPNSIICIPCPQNCVLCDYAVPQLTCVECSAGFAIQNDQCTDNVLCPDGKFNLTPLTCESCPTMCKRCYNAQNCYLCYDWMDTSGSCDHDCPNGEFQSLILHVCEKCDASCSICTINQCLSCGRGFIMDQNGHCYKCNCLDCGSCPYNCPVGTLFFEDNCYGKCVLGTFQIDHQYCEICSSACHGCDTTPTNCTSCQSNLVLSNYQCIEQCQQLYYPLNGVCISCFKDGKFQYSQLNCNSSVPTLSLVVECSSPTSTSLNAVVSGSHSFDTNNSHTQIVYLVTPTSFQSCISHISVISKDSLNIQFTSSCQFSGLTISLTVDKVLSSFHDLPFHQLQETISWPLTLNGQDYRYVDNFHKLYEAEKYTRYSKYFPVAGTLLPGTLLLGSLSAIEQQPYQAFALESFVGGQVLSHGCYLQGSYQSTQLSNLVNRRLLSQSQSATSNNFTLTNVFYLDYLIGMAWTAIGWLMILFTYFCFSSYTFYVFSIVIKIQQSFYLLLAFSMAQNIAHIEKTVTSILGLATAVFFLVYTLICLILVGNKIYNIRQDQDLRFLEVKQIPAYLKKINWVSQKNMSTGILHITDPVYFRLVDDFFLIILYFTLAFITHSITQFILVILISTLSIIRLSRLPFFPLYLNFVQALQWSFLLAYSGLGLYSISVFTPLEGQNIDSSGSMGLWMKIGNAMLAMQACFLLIMLIKEAAIWLTNDQIDEYVIKAEDQAQLIENANLRNDISRKIEDKPQANKIDAPQHIQIQKITVKYKKETFTLQILSINAILRSPTKYFLTKKYSTYSKIVKSSMVISHGDIFKSLQEIAEEHHAKEFVIKTIGVFEFNQANKTQLGKATYTYNIVIVNTSNKAKAPLQVKKLAWTPINSV